MTRSFGGLIPMGLGPAGWLRVTRADAICGLFFSSIRWLGKILLEAAR